MLCHTMRNTREDLYEARDRREGLVLDATQQRAAHSRRWMRRKCISSAGVDRFSALRRVPYRLASED